MQPRRALIALFALAAGCGHVEPSAKLSPTAIPRASASPVTTYVEARDHRYPLGTRLYRVGNGWAIVRPGEPVPAFLKGRNADIVVGK